MSGDFTGEMVETRNISRSQEATMESLQNTILEMQRRMDQMHQDMQRMRSGEGTSHGQNSNGRNGNGMAQYGRMSKIEFPRFNGDDVKSWLFRCKHFFKIDDVQEDMKVELAAMHLSDRALVWHQQFLKNYGDGCDWNVYAEQALKRFGNVFEDPMVELKNLKQTSTVQVYQDKFEDLLNRMNLTESLAMSLFIGGLKDEISMPVRMFKPLSLADLFSMAKMQKATLLATKSRCNSYPSNVKSGYADRDDGILPRPVNRPMNLHAPTRTPFGGENRTGFKRLTQKELEDKRAKNLCFYCDKKYVPGHKCSGQLHSLEVIVDEDYEDVDPNLISDDMGQMEDYGLAAEFDHSTEMVPQISLNALSGVYNYQTMRVKGLVRRQ